VAPSPKRRSTRYLPMCEGKGGAETVALKSGRAASDGAEAAAVTDEMLVLLLFMVRLAKPADLDHGCSVCA